MVHSLIIENEVGRAPEDVRHWFAQFSAKAELAAVSESAVQLHQAYLDAGIVGPKSDADALHVAVATASDCRLIVSWNFKHIVHFQKIPLYNGVNQSMGFAPIAIHSPEEVIANEDEDV